MNRAEFINAVVTAAVVRKVMTKTEAVRILSQVVAVMCREDHKDEDLTPIAAEINRRYEWVMVHENKKPW